MRVEDPATTANTSPTPPARRSRLQVLLLGLVLGVLGALALAVTVGGPLVIAKRNDLPLERAYGDFAVSMASRLGGGNLQNPNARNGRALSAGREAYTGSCSLCHGATGDGRGVFGTSSYPNATDLTAHDAVEKADGQLFWIVKNGLSFTGMPGFAEQYSDQEIWSLVTYMRALQDPGRSPQFGAIVVPTASPEQFEKADPASSDPAARGAAVYFALGCQTCHGAVGDAPGDLGLSRGGGPEAVRAIRQGRPGMPAYTEAQLTDTELGDLQAYLLTIGSQRGRR
jgi:mono/diheme cytochrome c family protein